ncbi:MAG: hypothetical protein KDA75_03905 [Planctomycetaceae bacterium]|nr:hypothetical protein [Planctomycetaceae bacterium]
MLCVDFELKHSHLLRVTADGHLTQQSELVLSAPTANFGPSRTGMHEASNESRTLARPGSLLGALDGTDEPLPTSTLVSPKTGRRFRIVHSLGTDPGDDLEREGLEMSAAADARRDRDEFAGSARKSSKTSIASAAIEHFSSIDALFATLPMDDTMIDREPPIIRGRNTPRVEEEQRNVRVFAFLYAASREDDNDFHLIIGDGESGRHRTLMNVEISGLPEAGPKKAALEAARTEFSDTFRTDDELRVPGSRYDFYEDPIPVMITGSLFYDIDHRPRQVGPASHRPLTSWEIHPITRIEFEP